MLKLVTHSLNKVEGWVERHDYRGYEPFDGLSSSLRPLTLGNLFAERVLQQLVRQSPFNIRPLLRIKAQESTKGRGYMASGYLLRYRTTGDPVYKEKALSCLRWLDQHKAPGYSNHSWGNHFDFSSRTGKLPRLEPIIVWSSLIGQAFLDAYELLAERHCLDVASSICNWILALPREMTASGECLSYVAFKQSSIHNSNMLGAAMLARTAKITGDRHLLGVARSAMLYSCSRQLPDGSWWYGEHDNCHWIDSFHTGYNIDNLKYYIDNSGDASFKENLSKGLWFYKNAFFEANGRPKYYHNRTYPVDIQCASQAIDTLALMSCEDPTTLELASRVARWTIQNLQDRDGHFYYRIYPWKKSKTPMLHWGQATMYRALAHLQHRLVPSQSTQPPGLSALATISGN